MSFDNFVQSTLSVVLTDTANILTLSDAIAPYRLPPTDGGVVVLADSIGRPTYVEIISYAARSGFNLTGVVRGLEGTTARAWGIGTPLYQPLTATGYQSALDSKKNSLELIVNKSGAYTVEATDLNKIINCTSGSFTVGLTAAATLGSGFSCWVWNSSSTATDIITVDPFGSEKIDGIATLKLGRGEGVQIICDGVSWQTGSKKAMRGYAENLAPTTSRALATGYLAVAIGAGATASNTAAIAMGYSCSAAATYSAAIGNNSAGTGSQVATSSGAMALGGSYASGVDSFAAAVGNNTSSYGALGASSIAIGRLAKATGADSVALSYSSFASGSYSFAVSDGATASGVRSVAIGYQANSSNLSSFAIGYQTTASGFYSLALGANSVAAQQGKQAFASGRFSANGDAQSGKMVLRRQLSGDSPIRLTSDGGVGTGTTMLSLPNDSTFLVRGQVVARNIASDTDTMCWEFKCAVRMAAPGSIAIIGTPVIDLIASDGSTWTVTLGVSVAFGSLEVRVTGDAAKTINWVCTLDTTEVTG